MDKDILISYYNTNKEAMKIKKNIQISYQNVQ